MISFRTTKQEREQLKAWTTQRGFKYISELIRATFGFQPGLPGTEPLDEVERKLLENRIEVLERLETNAIDRLDELDRKLRRIISHLGANRAGELPGDSLKVPSRGEVKKKSETGLPAGFER